MNIEPNESSLDGTAPVAGARFDIRHLSAEQLGRLGLTQIAYVRPVVIDGAPGFAIHAADGTPMALAADRGAATAAIVQHDMIPVPVH